MDVNVQRMPGSRSRGSVVLLNDGEGERPFP